RPKGLCPLSAPTAYTRNRVEHLLAAHRFKQVFATPTSHGLNNEIRLCVCRDGKYGCFRSGTVDIFCCRGRPAPVTIEVNDANIWGRIAQPVGSRIGVLNAVFRNMRTQFDQRGGFGELLKDSPSLFIETNPYHRERFA